MIEQGIALHPSFIAETSERYDTIIDRKKYNYEKIILRQDIFHFFRLISIVIVG